jgi:hypothetical protein
LNFSYAVGDAPECVNENLKRAAAILGVEQERLLFLSQVHGVRAVELESESWSQSIKLEGDATVSGTPDLACAVRTADCVPILVADQSTGRVAAIHGGWRGLAAGVIAEALKQLGGSPAAWIAAIGPHISLDAFEISEDVAAQLERCSDAKAPIRRRPDRKPHADLRQIAKAQLHTAGVKPEQVEDVMGCTQLESDRFFSYRRDGKLSGRHLSAIAPLRA